MKKHREKCRLGLGELPDINIGILCSKESIEADYQRVTTVSSDLGVRNAGAKERWKKEI